MSPKRHHLDWVRENILQHLTRVDHVISDLVPASVGEPGVRGDEPWVEQLFERRQGLQSTLRDVERQIEQQRA